MPTRYQSNTGEMVDEDSTEPKFPIYFCEVCGYRGAAFGVPRTDGRLSYCGWDGFRPVCVGKGKADQ